MMSFEEMLEEYLMEEKVENEYQMIFGECETSEEIILKMKEVTEKVLMKDQTHLTHRFAQARLNFMVEGEREIIPRDVPGEKLHEASSRSGRDSQEVHRDGETEDDGKLWTDRGTEGRRLDAHIPVQLKKALVLRKQKNWR